MKTTKASTEVPNWISEEETTKRASEFQAILTQEQSASSARLYSPFALTLRGPYKTPFLGPHYSQAKPDNLLVSDTCLVRASFSYGMEDIDWGSWEVNLERLGSNPNVPIPVDFLPWASWVDEMMPLFKDKLMQNRIFFMPSCCRNTIDLNPSLISAALYLWDSTSNTFAFGPEPMTPTILDMAALFGFRPWGSSINVLGDYEMRNRKVVVLMRASKSEIMRLRTYSGFVMMYQGMLDRDQEHMTFLLFWLNKFIFPHADEVVKTEYMHLAEALHNEMRQGTSLFMLASLYHCLYHITIRPFNLNVCGPVWMVQIWLEWYFPELGNEELEYLEDDVPATALAINSKRPVNSEECLIFLRECK